MAVIRGMSSFSLSFSLSVPGKSSSVSASFQCESIWEQIYWLEQSNTRQRHRCRESEWLCMLVVMMRHVGHELANACPPLHDCRLALARIHCWLPIRRHWSRGSSCCQQWRRISFLADHVRTCFPAKAVPVGEEAAACWSYAPGKLST